MCACHCTHVEEARREPFGVNSLLPCWIPGTKQVVRLILEPSHQPKNLIFTVRHS